MRLYKTISIYPTYKFMFVQRKTTELYQNLHNSLVQWQDFSPTQDPKQKPFFILLTHPHCMWTKKLCAEVFTNQEIVEILHKHFTPCLLDEHTDPELYILMNQSIRIFLKDQNTRPGCLFTHQTGEPFFGGGYHPPSPRYGMPSFIQFLHHAIRMIDKGSDISRMLIRHNTPPKTSFSWSYSWDKKIDTGYEEAFDFMNHGFGFAPKYLNTTRLKTWFTYPERTPTVIKAVERVICSPTFDPIHGCAYRKCEDALWELPVREAYLEDQAELISLMMQTHPKTPCISFFLTQVQRQYSLSNGLYAHSISYNSPQRVSSEFISWMDDKPHFQELPSKQACDTLLDVPANTSFVDSRAICASNAKFLCTLIEHHKQEPTEEIQKRIESLEKSIWKSFGWNETNSWFHTSDQKKPATGRDLALVIQAMLMMQSWKPQEHTLKKLRALVEYWEENYFENNICYTHPAKRFFIRGVDLVADTYASTQEEAAYTLSLLHKRGIPTKTQARDVIHVQQWLLYKNPKILSTALGAWKQISIPVIPNHVDHKKILAFDLNRPLSHQLLHYIKENDVHIWAQCETSQKYLMNHGYSCTINRVSWDICNLQGQLHTGPLDPEDLDLFWDITKTKRVEEPQLAFTDGTYTYTQSTYAITRMDGAVLLTALSPILCFCFCEDTFWWITSGRLHSSTSDTPHTLPSPLLNPISMCEHHGSILIAQREDLWLFHIPNEQFGRYAGRRGIQQKDGPVHEAVFQNITSMCTFEQYIFLSDAHTLRIIHTQTHMVHTLEDHPPFSYASSITMFDRHMYIADSVQQCVWQYSLEKERTTRLDCDTPKSMHIHEGKLWLLSHEGLIEIRLDRF